MDMAEAVPDLAGAQRAMAEGAFEAAAAAYAALSAAKPDDSDLHAFRAMALAKLGRMEEAEAVIAPALALRLKNIVPMVIAAEVATLRGDWPAAAMRWRRVADGNPRSYTRWMRFEARPEPVTPWLRHVEALYRAGADLEAKAALAEARAMFPDSLALLRLPAEMATERGDHASAGQHWTAALEQSGRHPAIIAAALAAAWHAGPVLRAAPEPPPPSGGYFVPDAAAQAWNESIQTQVPSHYQRPIAAVPGIDIVEGALVMPHMPLTPDTPPAFVRAMRGGVFDATGRIVPNAIQLAKPHIPDAPFGPLAAFEPLPGRWIFAAAHVYAHIGHFLMDCLGRVWAAERAGGPVDGLIFLTAYTPALGREGFDFRSPDRQTQFMASPDGFVANLLRIFGGITNIRVVTRPVKVEELLVPTQLLSLRPSDAAGHPMFRAFARRSVQAVCDLPRSPTPARIYVSRARLREDRGPLLQEEALERALEAQGYAVIYPEALSLNDQLRLYWNATHIITATGTAAHIAAMAMRGHQQVALLKRNPSQDGLFDDQLRAMGAARVTWVDAVTGRFEDRAPGAPRFRVYRAPHALDVGCAMSALHAAGFTDAEGALPDAAAEAEARLRFHERLRRFAPDSDYVFVPRRA